MKLTTRSRSYNTSYVVFNPPFGNKKGTYVRLNPLLLTKYLSWAQQLNFMAVFIRRKLQHCTTLCYIFLTGIFIQNNFTFIIISLNINV